MESNRRTFLRTSSTTAAAALGLSLVGRRRAHGANEKIRAAVVGIRGRGGGHIRSLAGLPNVEVAGLCDVDEGQLKRRVRELEKKDLPKPATHTDIRKLLDDKSIDIVSIATPNHWHSLGAIWAMQAGKDVYLEKPCSHNIWEGRQLVKAARKYKKICQHGTQIRSSSAIREGMQLLREGVIGEIYMAKGLCYKWRGTIGKAKDASPPKGVHYNLWLGPAPERPFSANRFHYNWHWHWDYGNGDLGNQGVHQMDIARWGLGVGLPTKVHGMGGHFMFDDDQETPNTLVTTFLYPEEEKMLVFEVRHWITNNENVGSTGRNSIGAIFYGSEGIMIVPSYSSYKVFLGKKHEPGPARSGGGNHFANFLSAVESRNPKTLHADIEEGHLSSALCHLGNVSYRLGRSLDFNPKTETFAGDPEANSMLTRDYRAPFQVPNMA